MTQVAMFVLNAPQEMSILLPSVFNNNLSTLSLIYFGMSLVSYTNSEWNTVDSLPNTPAAGYWNLAVSYTNQGDWTE